MCGIAGIAVLRPTGEIPALALQSMTRALAHRGPDGEGLWKSQDRKTGFGHRRLSIVDLSAGGAQPMASADGAAVITFNGEIYNFKELRRALEAKGHAFRSRSDTEVLLGLYLDRGARMVEDLDGDFAFAIYDAREKKVFLARDPAGVKPLYYAVTKDYFIFASEVRAILASGLVEKEVDEEALYHYMTYLVSPPGMTMVRGVKKLETASTLTVGAEGLLVKERYWDPMPRHTRVAENELDEELKSLFEESVAKRLMSDVPLGVLFSGGVDSTLNAGAFARAIAPRPVDGFTVGMPGTRQDESARALSMARHLGLRHHEVAIDGRAVAERLPDIVAAQDEPLSDPVCLPLYFVFELAKKSGVTVLQAGEGADELFCGYSAYIRYMSAYKRYWRPLCKLPRFVPRAVSGIAQKFFAQSAALNTMTGALDRMAREEEFFLSSAVGFYEEEKRLVLSREYAQRSAHFNSFDAVRPLYDRLRAEAPGAGFLQKITYIDLHVRLPELLLMRVDKMSMAHGLEVRVPFLDKKLIEFAMRVPDRWKLRRGIPKEPVKNLAAAYAPRDIMYQPKQGFGAPLQQWLTGALRAAMEDALSSSDAPCYFDVARLRNKLARGLESSRDAFQFWAILNFILWKNKVLDGG